MNSKTKVVIIGQGYVGLPVTMICVERGYSVVGLDSDARKIDSLRSAHSYVGDVSDQSLTEALATGRYQATTDYNDCQGFSFAVITVPTPLRESVPDLSFIEAAATRLAPHVTAGSTVILESTTYPGTTEELVAPILEAASGLRAGVNFHVGYSPERIDPGNAKFGFSNTPKVVSGLTPECLAKVREFYESVIDQVVPVSNCRVAELTKLLENTFRHVNVALVNELAVFAHQLNVNVWEAIDAAATKPFGYMRFVPGPGVGGHCLPVDPSYLSWDVRRRLGRSFRFVELANDVNDHMPDYVVERVIAGLNRRGIAVKGSTILVLGLAYKANTGDIRESPSLRVLELLSYLGADILAADPHVDPHSYPSGVTMVDDVTSVASHAQAVVLLTDHNEFDYDAIAATGQWVLDTRNRMTGPAVERL